jgi:hypothetical protein
MSAAARRVEYAWENLRGWLPNGRGVPNWTREMDRAVAALHKERRPVQGRSGNPVESPAAASLDSQENK